MLKNVLIISYYWPPSGGPGVQRVLKFCKYLSGFGWNPIVLTVEDGEFPAIDNSLLKDSINIECIKVKGFSLFRIFKKLSGKKELPSHQLSPSRNETIITRIARWVRYNLIIPDGRIGWYRSAVKAGKKIIKEKNIDMIFTSGPPQTVHLVGKSLADKTNTAWVSDFRDPWTDRFYYYENPRNKIISLLDNHLEKSVLKNCDYLVTVSNGFLSLLNQNFNIENKSEIIYNGYDPEDFKKQKKINSSGDNIIISHLGSLSKSQNPIGLFKSIISYNATKPEKLIIVNCIGSVHSDIERYASKNGLSDYFLKKPYVDHDQAIKEMINSDLLFLVIPDLVNNEGIIPGKLFEYIASNTKIILIGNRKSDAEKLMIDLGYKYFYDIYDNINFDDILIDEPPNPVKMEIFSRIEQTNQLSKIFNKLIS